jgi:hypothetical protein
MTTSDMIAQIHEVFVELYEIDQSARGEKFPSEVEDIID